MPQQHPVRMKKKKYRLRYRIRWNIMIPFLILLFLAGYLLFSLFSFFFSSDRSQLTICEYNKSETLELMNNHYEDVYEISDYFYYGERLNLSATDYDPMQTDELIGNEVELKNLCTGVSISVQLQDKVDQQIDLTALDAGYYELYVVSEGHKQRIVYDEVLPENNFSTIPRNEKVKNITLSSNPEILNNDSAILDKNYLFLIIEDGKPLKDVIDVFIDPYGNNTDLKTEVDAGQVYHNMSENKEVFTAALSLKKELENAGLRVMISRDSSEEVTSLFGDEGRLVKAYNAHAKYYIKLGMNGSPQDYARGTEIIYSAYSSNTMAKTILQELLTNTELVGSTMRYPDESNPGLIQSLPVEGIDGKLLYDDYLYVREAGGKATLAGKKDENSVKNTFALGNVNGMQSIELDYIYLSNTEDLTYWKENKDLIVQQTAQGLLKAWNIATTSE